MKNEFVLNIDGLSKSFKKKTLLDDVSIKIKSGECVALVGGNGSGKSSFLNMIAGISEADKGKVEFFLDGEKIAKKDVKQYVSYVPQNHFLLGELSAYDNLLFWYQGDKESLEKDLNEGILLELEIKDYIRQKVDKMSVGMQKRIAFACALANKPKLLLLDELNAPLDVVGRLKIQKFLKDYVNRGSAVLMSTHDEGDIRVCNKILLIKEKQIKESEEKTLEMIFKDES